MILIVKHIGIEGPGTMGEFFKNTGRTVKTVELNREDGLPDTFSGIEAVIVLGGPMNVYEEEKYPFLRNEDGFLKKAVEEGIPVLGICLGAQLLAKACGAEVKKAEEKEIGWNNVRLTEEGLRDPLFEGLKRELAVFQWHEDTFTVPKEGRLLATSDKCENQAFGFGRNTYGLQFHIEVTDAMIKEWVKEYTKRPGDQMLLDHVKMREKFDKQAKALYTNFTRLIARA